MAIPSFLCSLCSFAGQKSEAMLFPATRWARIAESAVGPSGVEGEASQHREARLYAGGGHDALIGMASTLATTMTLLA
jgi:hypothetical protein